MDNGIEPDSEMFKLVRFSAGTGAHFPRSILLYTKLGVWAGL